MSKVEMRLIASWVGEIKVDGEILTLRPLYRKFLELLMLRGNGVWVSQADLVEWIWPNPDTQPLGVKKLLWHIKWYLRQRGINIESDRIAGYRVRFE